MSWYYMQNMSFKYDIFKEILQLKIIFYLKVLMRGNIEGSTRTYALVSLIRTEA